MLLFQLLLRRGIAEHGTPFPGLLHFTLDPCFILLSVKQGRIKCHFKKFGMRRPGIEPRSPRLLVNTLPTKPLQTLILIFNLFKEVHTFPKGINQKVKVIA